MNSQTKITLAQFAERFPTSKTIVIDWKGEDIEVNAKRVAIADLLAIDGMKELLAKDEDSDFEDSSDDMMEIVEKLDTMEAFLVLATSEEAETISALPMDLKSKLFEEVFALQQLAVGTFPAAE